MRQLKRYVLAALLLAVCFVCSGCIGSASTEELYRLPKLPAEYESLEVKINELMQLGAEHAAPSSGSNLQSVQMVDLDGDDVEEAVAFFRKATDEKPMKIYFFKAVDDNYEQIALIEGTASSLYSIAYIDLDSDGQKEILVGFKSGTGLQVLCVYTLRDTQPLALLTTAYSRYAVSDLDGDGKQELTVFYSDEQNNCMADCYTWNDAELRRLSTIELSFSGAELSRVTAGKLTGGERALFVTGVSDNSVATQDILIVRDGVMQNVVQNTSLGSSGAVFRYLELYPTDINGDGLVEVPEPLAFPTMDGEGESYYCIFWRAYNAAGESEIVYRSFYNTPDGWSLVLPENWDEKVALERIGGTDESAVQFSVWDSETMERTPFLKIYTITGDSREYKAQRGERFVLTRQVDTVYAAEFLPDGENWEYSIDAQTLQTNFSLISAEWTTGEN